MDSLSDGAIGQRQRGGPAVRSDIPARLDRLPWSRFHLLVIAALGITWILDGLEVTIVGSIGPMLQDSRTLSLTTAQIGGSASAYVAGAVIGALLFGWLTDVVGRKAIFNVTLMVYVVGVLLSACAWNFWSFALFRAITGMGIGGEYSAINSAIDELIPARLRGRVDLAINGTFWIGAAAGAGASIPLLSGHYVGVGMGWRLGFGIGGVLGLGVLLLRKWVPESPRWLLAHGRGEEAARIMDDIEDNARARGIALSPAPFTVTNHPQVRSGLLSVARTMLGRYRTRSLLALTLMAAQAFLFNAIFFTYGMVMQQFYHVADEDIGLHILPLAAASFLGPLLLGPLFDTLGRRRMIAGTYAGTAVLLAITAVLFGQGLLTEQTQTLSWSAIFFVASAAASSAYLTASEIFPLEARGLAIALFYAVGTGVGGIIAPYVLGSLIGTGSAWAVSGGYAVAAVLMLGAAATEAVIGVDCEGCSLEAIALAGDT
ncbi:MAG: MFS transporter [Janthinobacterium lividum]